MTEESTFKLPSEIVKNLSQRSDWKGLGQLTTHGLMIVMSGLLLAHNYSNNWVFLFLPLYGCALIFVFSALHETVHFTAFKSRWLNNAVAAFCGFILCLPFQYFRAFHYAHHRYTQY